MLSIVGKGLVGTIADLLRSVSRETTIASGHRSRKAKMYFSRLDLQSSDVTVVICIMSSADQSKDPKLMMCACVTFLMWLTALWTQQRQGT